MDIDPSSVILPDDIDPGSIQPAGGAAGGEDPELAFLKPGFKRGTAPAAAPSAAPDRIGAAAAGYRDNLAGLQGIGGGPATPEHPMGTVLPNASTAAAGGLMQGATMGFADELEGGARALAGGGGSGDFLTRYRNARDEARKFYGDAEAAHPVASGLGELAGGLATLGLGAGAGAAKAAGSVGGAAARAAASGAAQGAIQGWGKSTADLTGGEPSEWRRAFLDAGVSGAIGGLAGGALGGVTAKIARDAEKNATGWVVKDIIGESRGASTATAKQQLADDAENAMRLMRSDKELDSAINKARHGGVDELKQAQEVIGKRLNESGSKLDPLWKDVDKHLPGGGVRAGDLVDHLNERIESLRASGLTTDAAEADALEGIVKRVSGARDFGAKTITKLDEKAQQDLASLQAVRGNVKDPATLKQIDDQIAAIQETGKKTATFDPDHVVPAGKIQALWSDEAGIAYQSQGGINGTATFKKKLEVASHLRDFRDQLLEQAAGGNPKVVADIRAANKDYSALKRMANVIDQRVNRATADAAGASVNAHGHNLLRKVAHGGGVTGAGALMLMHHPYAAAGVLAAPLAVGAKRAVDRGVANAIRDPNAALARTIVYLMSRGVPQATAIQMARTASEGGALRDVISPSSASVADEPPAETP